MGRSRWPSVAVATALLLAAAGGCGADDAGGGGRGGEGDGAGSDGPVGELATTLRSRFPADPTLFDNFLVANYADQVSAQILFEALILPSIEGDGVVNGLADTWEVADDGLSIDFALEQGIQFHDGYGEVAAEDVKYSLERAAGIIPSDQETGAEAFYTELERVDVTGTYSGTIVMKAPSVTLVEQALPLTGIVSKAAFEERGQEGFAQDPVGTGPYEFAEFVPGEHVRFTRFADYSGANPYIPEQRFEELIFRIVPEDGAAELAYEAGELDLLTQVRAASVSRFEGLESTEVTRYGTMIYRWIGMNVLDPALANRDLREAIIAAIDVSSIIAATSEGEDTRATALVAPNAPIGYWEDAPVLEQDLETARELVESVPEEDRTLRLTIGDDEISRTVAQIAQENLEDAGLTVEIETLDAASFFVTGESNRERQLFTTEFGINYREPTQELLWFTCGEIDNWNYMYWCDERYSELYAEAQTELDREKRSEIYIEMQEIFEEAAHTVWISHPTTFVAARTDTVEVVADPAGTVAFPALVPR